MINFIIYKIGEFIALHLPLRFAYGVARIVSDLHLLFFRKDRENVAANLRAIFPDKDLSQIRTIRQAMFRNFAKYLVDFFRSSLLNSKNLGEFASIKNSHYINQALAKGKGVILLSAHLGNWELGAIGLALSGYPVAAVFLPHRHKRVNDFFNSKRERKGVKVITLGRAVRNCLSSLRENMLVGLVGDRVFYAAGFLTDFFGLPTYLPKGAAAFSLQTGAPIVPIFVIRNSNDTYTLMLEKPIEHNATGNKETDFTQLLFKCKLVLEDYIKRFPEQWYMFRKFWLQNR